MKDNLPKLTVVATDNEYIFRPIINNLAKQKAQVHKVSLVNFRKYLSNNDSSLKSYPKIKELPNSFDEDQQHPIPKPDKDMTRKGNYRSISHM